ncbi:MAG: glycosyltransferase [Patescibacteria group bacterium]
MTLQAILPRLLSPFSSVKKMFVLAVFLVLLHVLFIYKFTLLLGGSQFILVKIYIILTGFFLTSRFLIIIFYKDAHYKKYADTLYPSVSFVIAAKNEEDSIYKTIETCMQSAYPGTLECIAVDDGSTDKTKAEMERAHEFYKNKGVSVNVISFAKNRGKREGMAEGILAATGEIVVFVDSDSFLEKTAVKHLVEHFLEDSMVGAVAGNTGVDNDSTNALTKMQSARYGVSFDIFKACESVFGTVTCCPGCFSAYRRTILLTVLDKWRNQMFMGTRSTFGDDRSLTNFVLRNWKVVYCSTAKAVTIVPDKYRKFFKQQLRWKKSWVREGLAASSFIWRKNIIASLSFYTNLLLPIFSPFIVLNALVIQILLNQQMPYVFLIGVVSLSFVYGLFYYWQSNNKYWWYVVPFTVMYTFALVWQMPYAVFKLRDTTWGTR